MVAEAERGLTREAKSSLGTSEPGTAGWFDRCSRSSRTLAVATQTVLSAAP